MGFFDKLAKGLASEVLGNIVKNTSSGTTGNTGQSANQNTVRQTVNAVRTGSAPGMNIRAYFAEILASAFSQYQVRENIPLSEFGAEGRPFDFGLYQNGTLVSVVVLAEHNRTRNHPYWNSQKKAQELNIPFINFYTHMPNERGFVINRIKRLMQSK